MISTDIMKKLAKAAILLALTSSANEVSNMIDPTKIAASNIPDLAQCVGEGKFRLNTPDGAPHDAAYFFVRYEFRVEQPGRYCLWVKSPSPGTSRSSQFTMAFDGGPELPVLRRQRVSPPTAAEAGWHEQEAVTLAAGEHTLEFRFRPEDRMPAMNRVQQPFVGHRIEISGLQIKPAEASARDQRSDLPRKTGLQVRGGETVVLFGDSITEEEFYGKHLARLLSCIVTSSPVRVYNAGVSGNRTWEGVARLERDVLALHPQWVVLAFGVNDGVHMAPEEFARNYELIVTRLTQAGIKTVCATPSGFCAAPINDGRWCHTPDRANGFDRTAAGESRAVMRIAQAAGQPCADVYGAFTRTGLERVPLMFNQWHPNDDGGRLFALEILRAMGATTTDVAKTGEPKDATMWNTLAKMPPPEYPDLTAKPLVRSTADTAAIVASSFTRNAVYAFSEAGQPLACVPVGHHPMGLTWNAVKQELYVACEGSGHIEVISVPGFKRQAPIALGDVYPVALALSNDGKTLWSVNFFGSSLIEVDVVSRTVRRTVPLGACGMGLAITDDGKLLIALAGAEAIFVDPANATILKRVKVSENPCGFCADAQGRLAILDTGRWTLHAVDPVAMSVSPAGNAPYHARAMCRTVDGSLLAGDWERGRIARLSPGRTDWQDVAEVEFPLGLCLVRIAESAKKN